MIYVKLRKEGFHYPPSLQNYHINMVVLHKLWGYLWKKIVKIIEF